PAVLPLTIMDIKKHLRITDDDTEDDLLGAYLVSAVEEIDGVAGLLQRALITQTWDLKLDGFPRMWRKSGVESWRLDPIRLPLRPLQEVVSVKYRDLAGNEQTLDAGRYQVTGIGDQRLRGEIVPAFGFEWPDTREHTPEAVTIRFKAGYGDDGNDVPEPIRH